MAWGGAPIPHPSTPGGKAKGPGGPPARYLNKASGKMESAKALKAYRAPQMSPRQHAAVHAMGGPRPAPRPEGTPQFPGTRLVNPGNLSKGELSGLERTLASSEKAELGSTRRPFQLRNEEIGRTEGAESQRFGIYAGQSQQALQGILANQEASAKTAQNQAAEAALTAHKAIESTGQAAVQNNQGYLDPQLREALTAGNTQIAGLGLAGEQAAQARAQQEQGFLNSVRVAATQRATEGQSQITSLGAKERQTSANQEGTALERLRAGFAKQRLNLPFEVGKAKLAETVKAAEMGDKRAKLELEGRKIGASERYQQGQLGLGRERNATARAKLGIEGQKLNIAQAKLGLEGEKYKTDRWYKEASVHDKTLIDESKAKYQRWQEGHPKVSSNQSKLVEQILTASALARGGLGAHPGRSSHQLQEKVRTELSKAGGGEKHETISAAVVSAAMNLAVYGRLGPNDKNRLTALGIDPKSIEG